MAKELKLVYFNLQGLAETSRLVLALARVKYEDFRFPFTAEGPGKFVHTEFDQAKASGELDFSMGKVPYLQITDNDHVCIIPQSRAIERYLARTFGFMGNDEYEAARIDAICECVRDIGEKCYKATQLYANDARADFFENEFRQDLEKLVKVMGPPVDNHRFAVGNKLSLADIVIYNLIVKYHEKDQSVDVASKVERIRNIVMEVAGRPEIIRWTQVRPHTPF